ncbi:Ser-Thr-rich GPI-anchored membrane family protein [Longimicrobium sp.]|uniref:Ser-Thr-rich GPI-anchored membrane family protein n=1 Tax=Longimicrobium sp. TaxID=2029185 RepID=UPI002E343D47|nr:Ser-Thr-rich GPI-anchored membrane family protein [Longimicrobium sp.]HEX6040417.1 Ser-Thr-rich GPI-anchored membrane family protein [Longimicrobium sp.]
MKINRSSGWRLAALGVALGMVLAVSQRALASEDGAFSFTVTSPGTGYQLVAGSTVPVTWTSTSGVGNVNLSLVDVNLWAVVATLNNTPDDGSENFTIPSTLPTGQYLFYVENVGVTEWAYGETFDILACGSQALRQAPRSGDRSRPISSERRAPSQN